PARDGERDDDAVADGEVRDLLAHLEDLANELVTEDVARPHRRDVPVVEVEIRAADRGPPHAHHGVPRVEDPGLGDVLHVHLLGAPPDDGLHERSLPAPAGWPSVRAVSPASSVCLKRRRSSFTCWDVIPSTSRAYARLNGPTGR